MIVTMDTSSINPASIIDEAVDLSMRLTGTDFPVSIFPSKIQRIINEVHECHNYPTDYIAAAILTAIAVGIGNQDRGILSTCPSGDKTVSSFVIHKLLSQLHTSLSAFYGYS